MKVLLLVVLAVAVAARPEVGTDRNAEEQKEVQNSASMPSGVNRLPKEREVYIDGAEIPVHLVYEQGDETEAVVKEVSDGKDPSLNRVSRDGSVKTRIQHYQAIVPRHRRNPDEPMWAAVTNIVEYGRPGCRRRREAPLREGLNIVKLKVRRGGVAIAGPGGVATAGSGGTAIVGPGGTAYTTPDGTAVVGPGGRLVQLSPSTVERGRAEERLIATGPLIYYPLHL